MNGSSGAIYDGIMGVCYNVKSYSSGYFGNGDSSTTVNVVVQLWYIVDAYQI